MKIIKLAVENSKRNYTMCVFCGRFGCDYDLANSEWAGYHRKCKNEQKLQGVPRAADSTSGNDSESALRRLPDDRDSTGDLPSWREG